MLRAVPVLLGKEEVLQALREEELRVSCRLRLFTATLCCFSPFTQLTTTVQVPCWTLPETIKS